MLQVAVAYRNLHPCSAIAVALQCNSSAGRHTQAAVAHLLGQVLDGLGANDPIMPAELALNHSPDLVGSVWWEVQVSDFVQSKLGKLLCVADGNQYEP